MSFFEKLKKPEEAEDEVVTDKAFMRGIITSFFAIAMCIIMLGASTYAWFTTSIQSTQTISSAVYVLSIKVDGGGEILSPTTYKGNDVYTLEGGKTYTVTVTAVEEGTTGNTGYIKLEIGDQSFVSDQIDRGKTITFTLTFTEETEVTIVEGWGTSSAEVRTIHNNGKYDNNNLK